MTAAKVSLGALAVLALGSGLAAAVTGQTRFREDVQVTRVLLDVRVVDRAGDPIAGLTRGDFRVTVDGRETAVEAVEWVSGEAPYPEGIDPEVATTLPTNVETPPAAPGRLLVFFFQKDFYHTRLTGLMRMKVKAAQMLATLTPRDRVAVVSFDSHLRLWTDFTDDHERLTEIMERSILFEEEPEIEPGPFPSLAATYDRHAALEAATPEAALVVLGEALEPLPGAKSLIMLGWGMGRFSYPLVRMDHDWEPARRALVGARVTVFSLDITDADYHTLAFGLRTVAEATGGFYAKTHLFPDLVMERLGKALSGHYVLVIEGPGEHGEHEVEVELVERKGTVMSRTSFVS